MSPFLEVCPCCFSRKGRSAVCGACGYNEHDQCIPVALPYRILLNNQYLIGIVVGKPGGFGITYLALDTRLDLKVAIKEYLPRDLVTRASPTLTVSVHHGEDKDLFKCGQEIFLNEARTLARFDHPNVVRVRNVFEENGTAYQVMDYYEGLSLHEYLTRHGGRLSEAKAKEIMSHIMDGLEEVHRHGFLHRDIKPHNIYITKSGRPILLDFGAARNAISERSLSLSVMLTPGYAPLEQYHKRGNQGTWTDVYGCAAVLYRMVTGETPPEATERVVMDTLPSPQRLVSDFSLSPRLAAGLVAGLATHPAQRPANISEFRNLLDMPRAPMRDYTSILVDDKTEISLTTSPSLGLPRKLHVALAFHANHAIGSLNSWLRRLTAPIRRGIGSIRSAFRGQPDTGRRYRRKRRTGTIGLALLAAALGVGYAIMLWTTPKIENTATPINPPAVSSDNQGGLPLETPAPPSVELIPKVAPNSVESKQEPLATQELPASGDTYQPGQTFRDCPNCPEMMVVPKGAFVMGSPPDEKDRGEDEGPQHTVFFHNPFALGKYEVTRAEYLYFVKETHYPVQGCDQWQRGGWKRNKRMSPENPGFPQSERDPVVCVSWNDAVAYTSWLSQKTGHTYRLPSEAEWEYSARAMSYWGEQTESACTRANVADQTARRKFPSWTVYQCSDGNVYTAPVGTYQPNAFGLYDMLGNIWEWAYDCWHDDYSDAPADGSVWQSADCSKHVLRGGSWVDSGSIVRVANRDGESPETRSTIHGFRVMMELPRN